MARVRVIIVNYNGGEALGRAVRRLAAQTFRDFEAVIVDNASTDGSIEALGALDGRFRIDRAAANLGFAAGNNRGAEGCSAPWIATLNPDAFAEPDWLGNLMAAAARHPDVVMFGSTQLAADDPARYDGCGDCYAPFGYAWRGNVGRPVEGPHPEGEVFGPCAAAALYRTDAFRDAGGFDARFFCYHEDVDLAFRLRLMGHRCLQVGDAVVLHAGSAIAGRLGGFVQYHSARNRLWTLVKNMPGPLLVPAVLAWALAQGYLVARTLGRRHTGAVVRGIGDGIRGLRPVWRDRRAVQSRRTARTTAVARAFSWSVARFRERLADVRPLPGA